MASVVQRLQVILWLDLALKSTVYFTKCGSRAKIVPHITWIAQQGLHFWIPMDFPEHPNLFFILFASNKTKGISLILLLKEPPSLKIYDWKDITWER